MQVITRTDTSSDDDGRAARSVMSSAGRVGGFPMIHRIEDSSFESKLNVNDERRPDKVLPGAAIGVWPE